MQAKKPAETSRLFICSLKGCLLFCLPLLQQCFYLLQLLPGAPEETISKLEEGIRRAGAVTPMLDAGMTPEDILGQGCGDLGVVCLETQEVSYKCYCSRERVESALISLGRQELTQIMEEGKPFPVECQFCDTVYTFTPEDVADLLKKI